MPRLREANALCLHHGSGGGTHGRPQRDSTRVVDVRPTRSLAVLFLGPFRRFFRLWVRAVRRAKHMHQPGADIDTPPRPATVNRCRPGLRWGAIGRRVWIPWHGRMSQASPYRLVKRWRCTPNPAGVVTMGRSGGQAALFPLQNRSRSGSDDWREADKTGRTGAACRLQKIIRKRVGLCLVPGEPNHDPAARARCLPCDSHRRPSGLEPHHVARLEAVCHVNLSFP